MRDTVPPLSHSVTLPVLGIATRFDTNSSELLEIVEEAFGFWRALESREPHTWRGTGDPLLVRVFVVGGTDDDTSARGHAAIRARYPDDTRVVFESRGSVAVSDPLNGNAIVHATESLVADRMYFRAEMLEAVTLALLSHFDRHPLHAAAVARGGRAALLAGPSGTGKSSLAYLCHTAGLDLLGDDHVRVQLEPRVRIWGWPARVRLVASDGASKSVIDLRAGISAARLVASDFRVCVLTRDGGPASLEPLDAAGLARALEEQLSPGFDRFPTRWPAVARVLVSRPGWRLNLSSDPRDALALVNEVLA
jgi:hypothetical protein